MMSDIKNNLLKAFEKGDFLKVVYEKTSAERENRQNLSDELIMLHNEGLIDVVAGFKILQNSSESGIDFFLTRHVFEKSLPELNASVLPVMECVLHLVNEAGQDLAAGALFSPYIEFCAMNSLRPKEALSLILKNSTQLADLLTPTIIAGTKVNIEHYLNEAIRCTYDESIEIRKRSIFSLGRIEYSEDLILISKALACLESAVIKETDDQLLGNLIKSAFSLYKQDKSQTDRIIILIESALSLGNEYSLHAGAEIFGLDFNEIPVVLLDILLISLLRVKPENQGTINDIKYGLTKLLDCKNSSKGIEFLEKLLIANNNKLSLEGFKHLPHDLLRNKNNILDRLMTRWSMSGEKALCTAIHDVVSLGHNKDILLSVVPSEFDTTSPIQSIFIARKAIGFLFFNPVTAASIIISLIELSNDDEVIGQLSELLFNPLLINYPGKVNEYLKEQLKHENSKVKLAAGTAITAFDDYFKALDSIGNIRELHPSQIQRDAHYRRFSRQLSESMKEGEKESFFSSLFTKTVLLYGNKSIHYIHSVDDQNNRMEIPLQRHSTEMEFPRLENIDPLGLDYMLRTFRSEQIT